MKKKREKYYPFNTSLTAKEIDKWFRKNRRSGYLKITYSFGVATLEFNIRPKSKK